MHDPADSATLCKSGGGADAFWSCILRQATTMAEDSDDLSNNKSAPRQPRAASDASAARRLVERNGPTVKRARFRDHLVVNVRTPTSERHPNDSQTPDARIPRAVARLWRWSYLAWIPPHLNWASAKPVIRCSVTAWVSMTFLLISKTDHVMGQVSIVSFSYYICQPRPADELLYPHGFVLTSVFPVQFTYELAQLPFFHPRACHSPA